MAVVHPSWWPSSRVGVVTAAAETLADDVLARPRSWLLTQASDAEPQATVVVEIAERLVVITGAEVVAIPRRAEPHPRCRGGRGGHRRDDAEMAAVVLIDAPSTVAGAPALATLIADAVRGAGQTVVEIDDAAADPAGPVGAGRLRTSRPSRGPTAACRWCPDPARGCAERACGRRRR